MTEPMTVKSSYLQMLTEAYEIKHGRLPDAAAQSVLEKAAYLETLIVQANESLDAKGLREEYPFSSRKSGTRENKALGQYLKLTAQQTKLLRELRLLPGSRAARSADDEPDNDLDDY